jgi:ubiquinone/menaquinone biosynthesis C-methylase UbiE
VRHRLRTLLPRLHVLPALNERPGDTVIVAGAGDSLAELAERVAPDGDVLVVEHSVDELERLRRETTAPNVSYLIGALDVLPLTDSSVDEVLATTVLQADAPGECLRVLRPGGRIALVAVDEDGAGGALNLDPRELERLFIETGFESVSVTDDSGRLAILARKP